MWQELRVMMRCFEMGFTLWRTRTLFIRGWKSLSSHTYHLLSSKIISSARENLVEKHHIFNGDRCTTHIGACCISSEKKTKCPSSCCFCLYYNISLCMYAILFFLSIHPRSQLVKPQLNSLSFSSLRLLFHACASFLPYVVWKKKTQRSSTQSQRRNVGSKSKVKVLNSFINTTFNTSM